MNNPPATTPPLPVFAAIRYLLRPLVRFLLGRGITFPEFSDMVKSMYVAVAEEEFKLTGKPQTDSRISLLTGIHRRDVKRLRSRPAEEAGPRPKAALSAQLVARWSGHPDYLDDRGAPRPLPRLGKESGPSFEALVQSVSKDFRPRVVLDEWLRQGVVTVDADDRVHLNSEACAPNPSQQEDALYFGQNIHDHMAAAVHNLAGASPPLLDHCILHGQLTPESISALTEHARAIGLEALDAVNRRAAELQERDRHHPGATYRTSFGVYQFVDPDAQEPHPPDECRAPGDAAHE